MRTRCGFMFTYCCRPIAGVVARLLIPLGSSQFSSCNCGLADVHCDRFRFLEIIKALLERWLLWVNARCKSP